MRNLLTAAALLSLVALTACNQQPPTEPAPAAEPTPEPVAPEPVPEPEPEGPTAEQLPVAEDFEQEVAAAITPENLADEVDALEKELDEEEKAEAEAEEEEAD